MKIYRKYLNQPWFDLVRRGQKIKDIRLNRGKFNKIEIGEMLIWFNNDNNTYREIIVKIIDKKQYKTIKEILESEGINNFIPDESVRTVDQTMKEIYCTLYQDKDVEECGVISITMKLLTIHHMAITNKPNCPLFSQIKKGTKTIEIKKYSDVNKLIKIGDIIIFNCKTSLLHALISDVRFYKTLDEILENEDIKKIFPCFSDKKDVKKYINILYNTKEINKIFKKYGKSFIIIEFNVFIYS